MGRVTFLEIGRREVAGPDLAGRLTDLGLIDEYRLYFRPFVLKPYFARARPPLRLVATEPVGEDTVRLIHPCLIALLPFSRFLLSTIALQGHPNRAGATGYSMTHAAITTDQDAST
jgi:hypothetical protein